MTEPATGLRAFKPAFVVLGLAYVLMASSTLVKGTPFLEDFGVSHQVASDPVLTDFFTFYYQLMAYTGVLTVVFGLVTRERRAQAHVASVNVNAARREHRQAGGHRDLLLGVGREPRLLRGMLSRSAARDLPVCVATLTAASLPFL